MKKALEGLDNLIYKVNRGVGNVFSVVLPLLAIFVFLNVLSRWLGLCLPWLFGLSVVTLISFAFLTAGYTLGEGKHVTVDVLTSRLPENSRVSLEIIGYVFCLIFVAILAWEGTRWLHTAFTMKIIMGTTTLASLHAPFWPLVLTVPLGAFFFGLQSLRLIAKRIHFLREQHIDLKAVLGPVALEIVFFVAGILVAIYINPIGGLFISLLALFFGSVPVAFALGLVGAIGLYLFAGGSAVMAQVPMSAFSAVESYPICALPLFVLVGSMLGCGGLLKNFFSSVKLLLGRIPGSLLMLAIVTGAVLCAITGSSVAATAMLSLLCLGELINQGFDKRLSCGTVAGASVGSLIPPSSALIVYGAVIEASVGRLFMGALIPSLIVFFIFGLYILVLWYSKREKFGKVTMVSSWAEKLASLKIAGPVLLLPILILGGIYVGAYTATEAAGVAMIYSFLLLLFMQRKAKFKVLKEVRQACLQACHVSSMTLWILIGGTVFAVLVSQLKLAPSVVSLAEAMGASTLVVVMVMFFALLVGGMFMSAMALMLITLPVFYPLAMSVGVDPLWLGVFYTICIEIGLLTPPVGINLFVIKGVSGIPFHDIVLGTLPFVGMLILGIAIIYFFPQLCTWLPSTM